MCWLAWALSTLRWHVRSDQTPTTLTVGLTLFITVFSWVWDLTTGLTETSTWLQGNAFAGRRFRQREGQLLICFTLDRVHRQGHSEVAQCESLRI